MINIAYFITAKNVIEGSSLYAGVDDDKLNHIIEAVQELDLQDILGADLYDRLQQDVVDGTLAGDYEVLLDRYVAKFLINKVVEEFIPEHNFTIKNGGLFKHTSDNGETLSLSEIKMLTNQYEKRSEYYKDRLISYLCDNDNLYAEYRIHSDNEVQPRKVTGKIGGILF